METVMKSTFSMFILFFLSTFLFIPYAIGYDVVSTLSNIDDFAMKTDIEIGQTALYKTYALFDPDKLPEYLRVESEQSTTWFCAATVLLDIKQASGVAAPDILAKINQYLYSQPSEEAFAYFTTASGFNPDGFFTSNDYQTQHFNFKWGPNHTFTLSDIIAWSVVFEEIWTIMVDGWGYDPVLFSDQYYVDVYLANTGDNAPELEFFGAYAAAYSNNQPYMVFHPDLIGYGDHLTDISAHEFFHCLQHTASHKPGGCSHYMNSENAWGIEGSAVWAQDAAYDQLNYYVGAIIPYAENPFFVLYSMDGQQIYSRVIWWKYVSENFGGPTAIYDLWNNPCQDTLLDSVGVIFVSGGSNFWYEFMKFVLANFFKDYKDGALYPDFHIEGMVSDYPATFSPESSRKPQTFGANYIQLNPPIAGADAYKLDISFEGETSAEKLSIYWYVQIAAMTAPNTYDLIIMDIESGEGEVTLEGFGTDYSNVYLIISPFTFTVDVEPAVNYTVWLDVTAQPSYDDDNDDDDNDENDDDDNDNDDTNGTNPKADEKDEDGCGC